MKTLEERREKARVRKQKSRANAQPSITLPLPTGSAAALKRVLQAAEFDDPVEFLLFQIRRLDELLKCDSHRFSEQTKMLVTIGDLSKFKELLGHDIRDESEDQD